MAAVYFGLWRGLRFEDPSAPAPPAPALLTALELAYLLPFGAAILLTLRWWRAHRPPIDTASGLGMLAYGLASLASFLLWDRAASLEDVRQLHALDAGISLMGLWPALALVALIRRTATPG